MFSPGDVVEFWNDTAGKNKYHLCVDKDGVFLFLNSPKPKSYPGDFRIPSKDIPCLTAPPEGYSVLSCTNLTKRNTVQLKRVKAKKLGSVDSKVLLRLIPFVEATPVLSQEDKDAIVNGLADWA
jgi:hypothetical protein